jgi:hypothetical protein
MVRLCLSYSLPMYNRQEYTSTYRIVLYRIQLKMEILFLGQVRTLWIFSDKTKYISAFIYIM